MGRPKGLPTRCTVEGCDRKLEGHSRSEGETHGNAKLTAEKVRELRRSHAEGATLRALAEKYGVSNVSIYNAVSGKTWRRLD